MSGGDWLAGYLPGYADEPQPGPALPASRAAGSQTDGGGRRAVTAIICRHCGSSDIGPRSSSSESDSYRFACKGCQKTFTEHLTGGYERAYIVK